MTAILPAGSNHTRLWGLTPRERLARIAAKQDLDFAHGAGGGPLVANLDYVFDPAWVRLIAEHPNHLITQGGVPVLAHVENLEIRLAVTLAMAEGRPAAERRLTSLPIEEHGGLGGEALRKGERPFMGRLTPETAQTLERECYFGAGTDSLTRHLWPEWALVLTRLAVRIRITPNQMSCAGALLCVAATVLFVYGWYWTGLLAGLGFMLLGTLGAKLARCTLTSSAMGNIVHDGIDLVHPPFWWWAWGAGLHVYGRPLEPGILRWTLAAIVGGYVVQRLIAGAFIALFKIHTRVLRRFNSWFRLITARRNPHMVFLLAFLAAGRPDWGLLAVAFWMIASLLVQLAMLVHALAARVQGGTARS